MKFKAREMPEFDKPFRPDHSKAALVTQSLDFSFKTDMRLGKAAAMLDRKDLADAQISRMNGAGYGADPFMAGLRGSPRSPRNAALLSPRSTSLMSPGSPRGQQSTTVGAAASRLNRSIARGADAPSPSSPRHMV